MAGVITLLAHAWPQGQRALVRFKVQRTGCNVRFLAAFFPVPPSGPCGVVVSSPASPAHPLRRLRYSPHASGPRAPRSAGSFEEWRPDALDFAAADLGNPLAGWAGERWLDIRSEAVKAIMRKVRLGSCVCLGRPAPFWAPARTVYLGIWFERQKGLGHIYWGTGHAASAKGAEGQLPRRGRRVWWWEGCNVQQPVAMGVLQVGKAPWPQAGELAQGRRARRKEYVGGAWVGDNRVAKVKEPRRRPSISAACVGGLCLLALAQTAAT
jgi:hypothetical protein